MKKTAGYLIPVSAEQMELTRHGKIQFPLGVYTDRFALYAGQAVPWHWHTEIELAVVLSGRVDCCCGKTFHLHEGDGFYIGPNVLHSYSSVGEFPAEMISIVFRPQMVQDEQSLIWNRYFAPMLADVGFSEVKLPAEGSETRLICEIVRLEGGGRLCAGQPLPVPENPLKEMRQFSLLSQLMERLVIIHQNCAQRELTPVDPAQRRLRQMIVWISAHYSESVRVQDIAMSAGVSESQCYRCFRQLLGQTPTEFLNQYRLERAAVLLRETDQSIAAVAENCGFAQQSYFSRLFRQATGMTPANYRRNP